MTNSTDELNTVNMAHAGQSMVARNEGIDSSSLENVCDSENLKYSSSEQSNKDVSQTDSNSKSEIGSLIASDKGLRQDLGQTSNKIDDVELNGSSIKEKQIQINNTNHVISDMSKTQKYIVLFVLSVTLFMAALEQTVVTAAIPQISAALESSDGYTWIGSAYLLASCSSLPISGKLSDIYGRKPILLGGIIVFLIGSIIAGASINMNMLIAGRVIQGLGCGTVMTLINIIISDVFPLKERGAAMSAVGSVWMIASCTGPLIGGAFGSTGLWRWCFYINLPIAGLMGVLLFFLLKLKSQGVRAMEGLKRVDFVGVILSTLATCLFLIALDWGGVKYPWGSTRIICFLVFSVVTYVIFFVYEELVAAEPLMPPNLFLDRTRSMSFGGSFCQAGTFLGIVYYLPFLYQAVYGASPIVASLIILPQAVIMGATSVAGGFIITKIGRYVEMMQSGTAFTVVFIGLITTLDINSPLSQQILFPALFGFANGFNFQSYIISLQTKVTAEEIGTSMSMIQYLRQLGQSISIAVCGVIFQNKISQLARANGTKQLTDLLDGDATTSVEKIIHLPDNLLRIAREYYMESFRCAFYYCVGLGTLGFIFSCLIPQNPLVMKGEEEQQAVQGGDEEESAQNN